MEPKIVVHMAPDEGGTEFVAEQTPATDGWVCLSGPLVTRLGDTGEHLTIMMPGNVAHVWLRHVPPHGWLVFERYPRTDGRCPAWVDENRVGHEILLTPQELGLASA